MATLAAPEQTSGLPPAKSPVWAPILKWALVAAAVHRAFPALLRRGA